MLTRRTFLLASLAAPLARVVGAQSAPPGKMLLSIHQNTSRAAGYRGSLEGWAKAGIQHVELSDGLLEGFLENDTLAAARRVLTDLGLTPVSAAAVLPDLDPGSGTGGIARDVEKALRPVFQPWPAEDLLRVDHEPESHR